MSQVGPSATFHAKTPPLNGAFPLDHEGECQHLVKAYLKCLKSSGRDVGPCRAMAKEYLECRMQAGLMERDDWSTLGFGDLSEDGTK